MYFGLGAVAALTGEQESIDDMVAAWDRRRLAVAEGLNAINGLSWQPSEGAFYAFVDVRGTGRDAVAYSAECLEQANVAVVPGTAFGDSGEGFVRMSFATSDELLDETVRRLGDWLGRR